MTDIIPGSYQLNVAAEDLVLLRLEITVLPEPLVSMEPLCRC